MVNINSSKKMVIRTYCSPLEDKRIMLIARKVHKNVAAKVKKEDTRDVILKQTRQVNKTSFKSS